MGEAKELAKSDIGTQKPVDRFSITLPICKEKITLRLATGNDEALVNAAFPIKPGDSQSFVANRRALLCACVASVGAKKGPITAEDLNSLALRDRSMAEMFFNSMNEPADQDEEEIKKVLNPFFAS
jgi:hypothetical protein